MPLARIRTNDPQQAAPLAAELVEHGFRVEFAKPGALCDTIADFEIEAEVLPVQAAIKRASALAAEHGDDIYVAPGALNERPVFVPAKIPEPKPVPARTPIPTPTPVQRKPEPPRAAAVKDAIAAVRSAVTPRRHKFHRATWLRAGAFAAIVTLAVMVGFSLGSRRSASPLSNSDLGRSTTVTESVPFGPATASAVPSATLKPSQPPATAKRPVQVHPMTAIVKPKTPVKVIRHSPPRTRVAEDDGGDEVVVRHFGKKTTAATTARTANKSNVKVYSDLE